MLSGIMAVTSGNRNRGSLAREANEHGTRAQTKTKFGYRRTYRMADVIAAEIERTLAATRVPGSRNKLAAADLRQWAVEYLNDRDEELARFPHLAGQPHWNLWMMDTELEDALFAVLVFGPSGVRFV